MSDTILEAIQIKPIDRPDSLANLCEGVKRRRIEGDNSGNDGASALLELLDQDRRARDLLSLIAVSAPYLSQLIERDAAFAHQCLTDPCDQMRERLLIDTRALSKSEERETDFMQALRRQKARAALFVALCDISGAWKLNQVTTCLADFADAALGAAVHWLLSDAHDTGKLVLADPTDPGCASGYVVLAMGKYGAGELNYSSDIDLIVLYDPYVAPLAEDVEPSTFFVRLTRRLVKLLQEPTGDGYVFRTDLRLRPDPRATSVAISLEAAALYYENMGQNWERAAMIKARPAAGDLAAGAEFLGRLGPFVWRKYLDFAAIADIQSLKRQIHAFKGHGEIAVAGHNIKLGRGGIREIEFFVQTQQLIAGGRVPGLRGNRTIDMLHALVEHDWIDMETAQQLEQAYVFLRTVEHRIQMVADEQTHTIPADPEKLTDLATFCGFETVDAFSKHMIATLETVQAHYADLFEAAPALGDEHGSLVFTGGEDDPGTVETLSNMGYGRPSEVSAVIRGWHFGRIAAMRSARSRELLTEITPVLLDALARTGDPDSAFIAFDRFLSGLPAGVQLFSLLNANPALLSLLCDILGTAPRLAEFLSHRPGILDAVLDPGFFGPLPDNDAVSEAVRIAVPQQADIEEVLDRARVFGREQRFRIGVRVLSDTLGADEAGRAYSTLAGTLIERLVDAVRREFESKHGVVAGGMLSVVAMGKLGGREMTDASDLDLMLIYDHDPEAEASDGDRSLMPSQYYGRLTQRLINAVSAQTSEGQLYEVDMRLRPSGNKGPIATHVDSFIEYHGASAWTWEKLALTRARPIAGDRPLEERMRAAVRSILCQTRDADATAADVQDMRRRIAEEKPARSRWDLKLIRGGLVDAEFICQYAQIVHAAQIPGLLDQNTGVVTSRLAEIGILDEAAAAKLEAAYRFMAKLNQILTLCVQSNFDPEMAPDGLIALLLRATDTPDLDMLDHVLREAQDDVKDVFEQVVGPIG